MRNLALAITLTALATLTALTTPAANAAERTARIEVGGLWCGSCFFIAGESLTRLDSVDVIEFVRDEAGQSAVYTVKYDDALTNPEEIAAQPTAFGYTAQVLEDATEKS